MKTEEVIDLYLKNLFDFVKAAKGQTTQKMHNEKCLF